MKKLKIDSMNKYSHILKKFDFNEYGVCINPINKSLFKEGYQNFTYLEIAKCDSGWVYALHFQHSAPNIFTGSNSPCSIPSADWHESFDSYDEAEKKGILAAYEWWRNQKNSPIKNMAIEALVKLIQPQLSLF